MKSLYEDLPPVEIAGRKLVGRVLFGLLVLISALVGATAGLLLVYTTDLPQVEALEAYRPSSITELYDDNGRVIGSFGLQRRVVAGYDDFPAVLRASPSRFSGLHRRQRFLPAFGHQLLAYHWRGLSRCRIRRQSAGRIHVDDATGPQSFSFPRPLIPSQSARDAVGDPDRAPVHQAANLHSLCQSDFSRPRRLRLRGCFRVLLRQACAETHSGGSRLAGRPTEG